MVTDLDPGHVKLALRIARWFARKLPSNVQAGDLEQAALMGLLDGLRRHPGGTGPGFESYLGMRIRGAVLDELRAQDFATRRQRARSAPVIVHVEDGGIDEAAADTPSPEALAIVRIDAAAAWRAPMDATDRRVMVATFELDLRQQDISAVEGFSHSRVQQRQQRGLEQMRRHLQRQRRRPGRETYHPASGQVDADARAPGSERVAR